MDTPEESANKIRESLIESKNLKDRIDNLLLRNEELQEKMKKSTFDITQLPPRYKKKDKEA